MTDQMTKHSLPLTLLSLVILMSSGCSDSQEADVVELPEQSDGARRVIFDKDGVVEIHEGEKLVFEREQETTNRLPPSPMPDADSSDYESDDDLSVAEHAGGGDSGQLGDSASAARAEPLQASHVPPKLTPTALASEPLTEQTPAKLVPLPPKVAPPVPKTTYAVQVGFFGQRSNAENLRDVLSNNDWPVKLIKIEKKAGKVFYLVVVPVRGNRDRANTAKAKIQKQHRLDGIVIRMDSLPN